jgi:hypothetical protein
VTRANPKADMFTDRDHTLRRFWWIVVVTAIVVSALALAVGNHLNHKVTAKAVVVVSPGPGSATSGPGNGDQANAVAAILTGLIPQDQATIRFVAKQLGISYTATKQAISASNEQSTSLIDLSFRAGSGRLAQDGAIAFARAVSGRRPVSPNIPRATLSIVSLPPLPPTPNKFVPALPIGIVFGILLGAILMVGVGRSRPAVFDPESLSELAGCPSSVYGDESEILEATLRLLVRGQTGPLGLTVVPATKAVERSAVLVAEWMMEFDDTLLGPSLTATPTPVPTGAGSAELTVALSDVVVLVVGKGTRDAAIRRTLRILRDYDRAPAWALLRPQRRRGDVDSARARA